MSIQHLVRARQLTKKFGSTTAVDQIDFDIHPGEVVGFLGPNGAGKTTTIRMMLNLLAPTSGELTLFNKTFLSNRTDILQQMNSSSGALPLPGKLSVKEILTVFGDFYSVPNLKQRVKNLIERFDLVNLSRRPLYSLSSGQQVRVSLAKAFLNQPRLLLLDEPTANLDPEVADRVRSYLIDLVQKEGTTVFLTSHNMPEVESICTRVLFLNHGTIQAEGTPQELARQVKRWHVRIKTNPALTSLPLKHKGSNCAFHIENGWVEIEMDKDNIGPFLTDVVKDGTVIQSITIKEPTLEDFFVHSARTAPKGQPRA